MPKSGGQLEGRRGGVIVLVGHGPSILSGRGAVIDRHTVVRLKAGTIPDSKHWGTRTDYLCARSPALAKGKVPYWHFFGEWTQRWLDYFDSFGPRIPFKPGKPKPSTGLCAVFCAMEFLKPSELAVIGFDRMLSPNRETFKWNSTQPTCWPHDPQAEHAALYGLGIPIVDMVTHG